MDAQPDVAPIDNDSICVIVYSSTLDVIIVADPFFDGHILARRSAANGHDVSNRQDRGGRQGGLT